jgi:hypothetical protein
VISQALSALNATQKIQRRYFRSYPEVESPVKPVHQAPVGERSAERPVLA